MNSSELLRRRQEAANQYKSYWKARDASEVTMRNSAKPMAVVPLSNYKPTVPYAGTTVVMDGQSTAGRVQCDTAQGPGNGFSPDYTYSTALSKSVSCAVCTDIGWSAAGGMSLQTCAAMSNIIASSPANPMPGLRTVQNTTNSNSSQQYQGNCPPNNAAQTPHFAADPTCVSQTTYYPPVFDADNVYYGKYTPHYALGPDGSRVISQM
jgi:hypothetical protein